MDTCICECMKLNDGSSAVDRGRNLDKNGHLWPKVPSRRPSKEKRMSCAITGRCTVPRQCYVALRPHNCPEHDQMAKTVYLRAGGRRSQRQCPGPLQEEEPVLLGRPAAAKISAWHRKESLGLFRECAWVSPVCPAKVGGLSTFGGGGVSKQPAG